MQRGGLAFDQCRLIEHDTHNTWLTLLLQQMTKEAPPGYARVSMEQALRADKEVFRLMSQEIVGKLSADASGKLPMYEKLKKLIYDPRITMHLLPLPKGQSRVADTTTNDDPPVRRPNPNPKKKIKRLHLRKLRQSAQQSSKALNSLIQKGILFAGVTTSADARRK